MVVFSIVLINNIIVKNYKNLSVRLLELIYALYLNVSITRILFDNYSYRLFYNLIHRLICHIKNHEFNLNMFEVLPFLQKYIHYT